MAKSKQYTPEEATLLEDLKQHGVNLRRRLAHEANEQWDEDRQLPVGMPMWWSDYLLSMPRSTRRQTHALAILYCGQPYKDLRAITGLSEPTIAKRLKHPAFRRFLSCVGTADQEGEVIATKDTVREYWTSVLLDDTKPDATRMKAGDLLMRSLGGYIDKVEHSGSVSLGDLVRELQGEPDDPFG